jgi:glucose-1-phosphate cytidylyltransferase
MKVVLFCGGLGMRLREFSETIPKPMVTAGHRPILWNVMKYYAHYGHKDFILCLGHQGNVIKEYFLNYNEALSNDFVLSGAGNGLQLLGSDIQDWKITFVDTGLNSSIGQRLRAVQHHLKDEEIFLANYSDGLSDLPLDDVLTQFHKLGKIASFVSVGPSQSFDVVVSRDGIIVDELQHISKTGIWMNGGYFTFRQDIFKYMREGEELVYEPFRRLIAEQQLITYRHNGFFMCMDTFKEKRMIDDMVAGGNAPWEVWKKPVHPNSR